MKFNQLDPRRGPGGAPFDCSSVTDTDQLDALRKQIMNLQKTGTDTTQLTAFPAIRNWLNG